jgi:hypothetical protein
MVDPGDFNWNRLLAELSELSKIVEQSANGRDREPAITAAPILRKS